MSTLAVARTFENPVIRDRATFLETVAESGGARTLVEVELAPGGGNPPHRHPAFVERFEVLEGRLDVRVGEGWQTLQDGEAAVVEIGVKHCFRNAADAPVRFLVEITPGDRGFEETLQIGYGLAADGLTDARSIPRNPLHTAAVLELSGMRVTGALGLAGPLLWLLARVARHLGTTRTLQEKYVRV
ncbi:MAG TPA: cupin domain-containing protein [Solirubrobacteraceae bacterium]